MNGHWSDCSTNNRGCPELLGPCDCGYELKVQHKWLSYLYRLFCNQVVRWRNGVRYRVGLRFSTLQTNPTRDQE